MIDEDKRAYCKFFFGGKEDISVINYQIFTDELYLGLNS